MAKGEAKRNNQLLDIERNRSSAANAGLTTRIEGMIPGAEARNNQLFGDAYNKYNSFYDTGGWMPEDYAGLIGNIGEVEGIGREFSKTGGWNEGQMSDFRARGTRVVPSFYSNLRNELSRLNTAGGGSVGYNSQMGALSRDASEGANAAVTDTEVALQDMIRKGRLAGAGIMSDAGRMRFGLGSSRQAGREFGAAGIGNMYGMSQDQMNNLMRMLMTSYGMTADDAARLIQMRMGYNPNKSAWDRAQDIVRTGATVAGAFV